MTVSGPQNTAIRPWWSNLGPSFPSSVSLDSIERFFDQTVTQEVPLIAVLEHLSLSNFFVSAHFAYRYCLCICYCYCCLVTSCACQRFNERRWCYDDNCYLIRWCMIGPQWLYVVFWDSESIIEKEEGKGEERKWYGRDVEGRGNNRFPV